MQLGPDDKIYVVQSFNNKVGRIDNPNTVGVGCNYDGNAVNLGVLSTDAGLVDKIVVAPANYSIGLEIGNSQTVCNNSHIIFDAAITGGVPPFTYSWAAIGDALNCTSCKHPSVDLTQNSTYALTVTDANNKTAADTVDFTISATNSTLQLVLIKPNSIDCTHPVDTTYAQTTNATEPVSFHWGDGSNQVGSSTELHMYSHEGIYVISVTDSLGCINAAFDTVVNAGIAVTVQSAVPPICVGDTSGIVVLSVSGGTAPYTYDWSNGSTTNQLDSVPAGSYSVTVTDAILCSVVFDYNLNPANDVWGYYVYLTATDANCGNTGAVLADVHSGVPPYSYLWSNGDTIQNIAQLPGGTYSVIVSDSSGCKRRGHAEVEAFCVSLIKGSIFVDTNSNCIFDLGEQGIPSVIVSAYNNGHYYYGSSNSQGDYVITVPDTGTYTIDAAVYGSAICSNFSLCNNPNQEVVISGLGDSSLNNNFVSSFSAGFDLTIHPGWSTSNPGFDKEYWILPYNQSSVPFSGQAIVTMVYDSLLTYQYSTPAVASHDVNTHTLTWILNTLPSPHWDWYNTRLRSFFHVPVGLSLGQHLQTSYYISPVSGDCDSTNNEFHSSEIVTGSLDPNEKEVEPANSITPEDSVLHYTIHFQNCGTDSTHFIIIKDTLSSFLEPMTVKNVASSHPYSEFNVSGAGILTWVFNPLRLVDSITNPRGSQGFVSFTVQKKKTLMLGSVLSNTASIYFDYNVPVQTNTVTDTVKETPSSVSNLPKDKLFAVVSPNPSESGHWTLTTDENSIGSKLEVNDVNGKLVYQSVVGKVTTPVDLNVARGVYFLKITSGTASKTLKLVKL